MTEGFAGEMIVVTELGRLYGVLVLDSLLDMILLLRTDGVYRNERNGQRTRGLRARSGPYLCNVHRLF